MPKELEIGKVKAALEIIADKGWLDPLPQLHRHPALIIRASDAIQCKLTNADLEVLYDHLQPRVRLRPFEQMTAQDFLKALEPANLISEVAA